MSAYQQPHSYIHNQAEQKYEKQPQYLVAAPLRSNLRIRRALKLAFIACIYSIEMNTCDMSGIA
jgi:hypothetical protein